VFRSGLRGFLAVSCLALLAACQTVPPPVLDEQAIGAPLPDEAPPPNLIPAPPPVAIAPTVIRHGLRRKKWVALTFDACSTQGPSRFDEAVIRTLIRQKVPATLFLGGKWMVEHPDETMELANHPQFELANHTHLHPHLTRESDEHVREELRYTQDILHTLTGRVARLFRAPYGELDARVARLAAEQGLVSVQYDLASGDPDPKISARRLSDYVIERTRNGSIVVLHMNGRGWHTAEALPRIIYKLRKQGYKLMTVGTLLDALYGKSGPGRPGAKP
jgi:peptidoglycan/xylan/chitin deacetylase (PgdA/CDA1 family)